MKNRIKEVRKQKGITQKELASRLGVVPSAISQFESGDGNMKIETLEKIAVALGCEFSDLIML
jgi:transcriptional regulator with XRE-family HTH domain